MSKWMKLLPILALVAILVAPMSAFANSDHQQNVQEKYQLIAEAKATGDTVTVTAKIDGATSAKKGHWKVQPLTQGLEMVQEHRSDKTEFTAEFKGLAVGEYCFKVHYNGKLNGETPDTVLKIKDKEKVCATVSGEDKPGEEPGEEPKNPAEPCKDFENLNPEDLHEIALTHKENGNKIEVMATLSGVKEAEGSWTLMAGHVEAMDPAVEETRDGVKGASVSFEIDKTKLTQDGEYLVVVMFNGKADGKDCQWGVGLDGFTLEGDDVTPPAEEPKTPKTPDGKKDVIDKVKGGKLPKTATSYPTAAVAGAVALLAGVALLAFRRTA